MNEDDVVTEQEFPQLDALNSGVTSPASLTSSRISVVSG
jgi:hypothetical protein